MTLGVLKGLILRLTQYHAQVAQSVEQWIENPRVGGSIPPLGTILMGLRPIKMIPTGDHHSLASIVKSLFTSDWVKLILLVSNKPPIRGSIHSPHPCDSPFGRTACVLIRSQRIRPPLGARSFQQLTKFELKLKASLHD